MDLEKYIKTIQKENIAVDSIFVSEKNTLQKYIINEYSLHQLRSCSKIFVAFAYGIAMHEKYICKDGNVLTLDTKVYSTFEKLVKNIPEYVKDWTIRTLLTHTTGYEKMMLNEKHIQSLNTQNYLQVLFDTKLKHKPNTHFVYSNVEPYLLSVFFQENFGKNLSEFVNEKIFIPMGINKYFWKNLGQYCAGATGLEISHNDFHKIAQMFYDDGKYQQKQIVPRAWVLEMKKAQVECPDYYKKERFYPKISAGYFVWQSRDKIVFRDGADGQYIICDSKNDRLITIMSSEKEMSKVIECLRGIIE